MLDSPWFIAALGAAVLVLTLVVNLRRKMLHDLEIIEKLDSSPLDPNGTLRKFAEGSFLLTFRMAYGWMALWPGILLGIGATSLAVGLISLVIWLATRDPTLFLGGCTLVLCAPAILRWGWQAQRDPGQPHFRKLWRRRVDLNEPYAWTAPLENAAKPIESIEDPRS